MFDARSGATDPVAMVSTHRHPVAVMRYNEVHNTVISVDAKGRGCATTGGSTARFVNAVRSW